MPASDFLRAIAQGESLDAAADAAGLTRHAACRALAECGGLEALRPRKAGRPRIPAAVAEQAALARKAGAPLDLIGRCGGFGPRSAQYWRTPDEPRTLAEHLRALHRAAMVAGFTPTITAEALEDEIARRSDLRP